eukprot:SAG11_NODE_3247_length_2583_cov_2.255233_1_plen_81_part_10
MLHTHCYDYFPRGFLLTSRLLQLSDDLIQMVGELTVSFLSPQRYIAMIAQQCGRQQHESQKTVADGTVQTIAVSTCKVVED